MDEEVVIDLFNRAQSKGYTKSIEDFKLLLETDEDVIIDNFNYVKSKGYAKPIEDFKVLVKKKDETTDLVSPQEEVVTTSVTEEVETPGVSDVSVSEEVVEETPELPKYLQQAFEPKTEDKSFNEAISTVVLDDIDKDEEILVPELLEKFNKYGFSFEKSSMGDAVTVFDYDGNPLEIDLQPFTDSGKEEEYNKLIKFLNDNRRDPKKIQEDLDAEAEDFKILADRENKNEEASLLFPQAKTSETGAIQTGLVGVIGSLFSSPEQEEAFVVSERANKYITAGGEKYKQQDFDRLFEENVKALEIGDDGKPSAAAVNQAAYDAKIQQRINAQEDFINTLSPERKALAEALKAVRDAQRAGASTEDINDLKQKFNDLYNIDAKKLYNFDGTYIEEGNAPDEVVAFNNKVEEGAIEKYESYTPEELEDLQVDLLYKTIFSAKKINTHADKIYEDLGYFVEGPFQALKKDVESLIDGDFYKFGKNLGTASIATDEIKKVAETGRITETLPLLPGNSPLVQEYNNNVKQLLEIQGALALNYNPSTLEEEGYFSPLKAFAVSAYEASTGQDVRVADDMVKAYVSAREDAGLKVTEKDKQRAEDSILDEGMAATGTIIPLIAEIAITKKAINLTGALKNMKVLTRYAQMQTRNPYKRLALGTISAGLQEALVFKSTGVVADQLISGSGEGMTGAMGFGFGVGGYAGGMITKALLGTRSPILQAVLSPIEKSNTLRSVFNGTANATVGTGALYGAEFFDTMVNTDKGFSEAAAEVLDVEGSPLKKLLVSFSTMGALGLGNRKGWKNIYDAMRKDIENYKPMKPSEYSKAVETLGLDPKKEYTAEEIKTAYRNKVNESHPDRGGSNEAFIEVREAYDKLTTNEGMLLEQQNIRNQEGYKKKRREMFFMANRMKNNVEFTGKKYELDYRDAEAIKDLSNTQLEVLTQDLKNQGISGQDAFTLQGKVQTARNHLKTINEVGITEPGARKRVYDLLNKFTEADRKLEELKTKAKTSKANEALFSEKIKQQEAEVKDITDNLQKEITKADKEVSVEEPTEGVLRLEGKEPVKVEPTEVKEEVVTEEVVEETPTTEVTEEVSKQEMEDMDRVISGDTDVQFRKKPKFRKEGTEPRDEVEADVEALLSVPDVELVNKKLDLSLVESPSVELDITDMKSRPGLRDDIDIKEVEINDFQGLPVGLTISDQLTVGDVTNPYTGNIIKNNKGGLGFGFTPGNKGLGWTYVDLKTAGNYRKYYKEIYDKNPEPFDKAWEEGRLPKGHIPVFIIKMGPTSMQSNQKVFSVLADNIKKLPKKNKVAALKALKQDLINAKEVLTKDVERGSSIKTGEEYKETTLNNKIEEIKIYEEILQTIDKNKYKSLDELVDDVATKYKLFTLDQRKSLIGRITSGAPNAPGEAPKKPGKSKKTVSSALLEGRPKEDYPLLHLGSIMDVVTEPVTKDVPERHVIGVTAIDIFSEPVASDHPNYKGGLKGQMLGVVKNTAHLKDIYPAAYGNVIEKAIRKEESEKKVKPITEGTAISQGISLTMGLTDITLRGQTISQRLGEREKLIGFLGQAFPATTWFTDPVTWERVLSSDGVKQYVKNGEVVYGMTRGGDIYLNPKFRDLNTPIHEAGHILLDYYEVNHPELFKKGMKLVEGTKELKEAIAELGDNVKARKEALATLIGNEGETLSGDKKKRFKEWLLQLWKALKAKFPSLRKLTPKEISNLTLEDFIGGSLKDIFSGRAITRDKVRSTERKDIDIHFRKGDNIYDIVRRLRNAGFETGKIKVALKSKGYDRKEILKAVEVPVDILRNLPESFGNIKGGVNEGIKLYESVLKEMKKPSNKKLPIEQNLDKGIEFLKKQEAFIAEGDTYKVKGEDKIKKEMSTQQKQMIIDFERSVGMKSSRRLRAEVSNLKKAIRERKAGERDIKKIQSELRLFIRKTLPTAEYKKSEVTSLISKINKATKFNIDKLMDEVFDLAVKKNVQITESNINSIINGKYDKVEGGRLKGTKISTDAKDRLDRIKSLIAPAESSIEKIQEINNKLNNRFNELSEKTNLTDEQLDEMVDIETATYYNSARLLENTDLGKLNDLYTVENNLIELIERGKTERKAQLQRQHEYYKDIVSDAYKDITGVELDVSEEGKKERDKEMRSYREKMKNKMSNRIKATGIKVVKGLEKFVVLHEDFTGLIDMISKSTGEMFGGRLQELTTDRIDDASYEFKQRKEEVTKLLFDNIERIYGKDWKKKIRKNRIKENTGAKLETGEEIRLSQDEAYYLYNQYKDPANHPGFETKYGEGYKEIMEKITKFLKPEVKEWADWQVDVLFPELYKRYNEVYKRIHRTNMPWNSKYAGRIKRQDVDLEPLDLLEANTKYATSIGGASTKMRIKNSKAIEEVNGNDMLFTYLQDMEFFAAYAEPLRDIDKILKNKDIRNAIKMTGGEQALTYAEKILDKVATRGIDKGGEAKILNWMTDAFVTSRLGFNPVVGIKQLTSAIAYIPEIGIENWVKYGAPMANIVKLRKIWREITDNSVYIRDRYAKDIRRTLESYSEKDMVEVVPQSFGNKTIDVFMYLIKTGDKGGIMGGIPNYLYHKDAYKKKNPKASEQDAINYAIKRFQKTTKKTQQSGDIQDKDILQLTKSLRPLMMFMTSVKQYQRKINSAIRQLYRKTRGKASKGSLRENLATFFMYHTLLPVFFHYIGLGLPGLLTNWDDEDRDALGMTSILGVLNSFAILGDIIETARELYEGKPWAADVKSAPPVFTIISSIADNISKYTKSKTEETKSKYLNKLLIELGTFAKLPAGNIKKLYDNYSKVIKGETKDIKEDILRLFNFSDYVIEEKGNKKGKNEGAKLQELLGEPKKTSVIKDAELEDVELEDVELEEVELEEVELED